MISLRSVSFEQAGALVEAMLVELDELYGPITGPVPTGADFAEPPSVFLVASLGGRDVGCGGLRLIAPGTGELKRMYADPAARGRGVGRALVRGLVEHARSAGLMEVVLDTGHRQPAAIALYESEGFTVTQPYGDHAGKQGMHFYRRGL